MDSPGHSLARRRPRGLFLAAGLSAMAVTLIRGIAGGRSDLAAVQAALVDANLTGVVLVNWHALTAIFALLSLALLLASRRSRGAACAVGLIAGLAFGATALVFMAVSARQTGSPFTWFPWIPLGLTSAVSFAAAVRACRESA